MTRIVWGEPYRMFKADAEILGHVGEPYNETMVNMGLYDGMLVLTARLPPDLTLSDLLDGERRLREADAKWREASTP